MTTSTMKTRIRKELREMEISNGETLDHTTQMALIATALHNGMTIEQIAKMDPKELAQAHLHTQNKATDAAAKQILSELK
jgi:succinyl-CoA synthetase beta subunit